jgi:hypothetical protein
MARYEQRHGIEFEIVMIRDAEDLVHPRALQLINWFLREYQMVHTRAASRHRP